jgi:hypothetical protein
VFCPSIEHGFARIHLFFLYFPSADPVGEIALAQVVADHYPLLQIVVAAQGLVAAPVYFGLGAGVKKWVSGTARG